MYKILDLKRVFSTFQETVLSLLKVDAVQRSSQFDIVYIWISKINAIIATIYQLLLQYQHSYTRWLSNCGIYIRSSAYFYIHQAKQHELQHVTPIYSGAAGVLFTYQTERNISRTKSYMEKLQMEFLYHFKSSFK